MPCHVYWVDSGVTLGCNDVLYNFSSKELMRLLVNPSRAYSKPLADKLDALVRKVVETVSLISGRDCRRSTIR